MWHDVRQLGKVDEEETNLVRMNTCATRCSEPIDVPEHNLDYVDDKIFIEVDVRVCAQIVASYSVFITYSYSAMLCLLGAC